MSIIADTIQRPLFTDETVDLARQTITYENEALLNNPECELLLTDWAHAVCFAQQVKQNVCFYHKNLGRISKQYTRLLKVLLYKTREQA